MNVSLTGYLTKARGQPDILIGYKYSIDRLIIISISYECFSG